MGFQILGRRVRRSFKKLHIPRAPTIWTPRGWIFYSSKVFKRIYRFGIWLIPPSSSKIPYLLARPFTFIPFVGKYPAILTLHGTKKPISKYSFWYSYLLFIYFIGWVNVKGKTRKPEVRSLDPIIVSIPDLASKAVPSFFKILDYLKGKEPTTKRKTLLPEQPKNVPLENLPKTLIISINTLFITKSGFWSWNPPVKRPGYEEFLKRMSQIYEVVILTNEETWAVDQTMNDIDPKRQWVSGKLGTECMRRISDLYFFDMLRLGRSLKKVVVLTADPMPFYEWQSNTVCIESFENKKKDNMLLQVAPFLEHLAKKDIKDVREEIKHYGMIGWVDYYNNLQRQRGILNEKRKGMMQLSGRSKSEPKRDLPKPPAT